MNKAFFVRVCVSQSLLPSSLKPLTCLHIPKQNRHTHIELFDISHTGIGPESQIGFLCAYSLITYLYVFVYETDDMCTYSISLHASM